MVVRFFILNFHYRSAVDFSEDALKLAEKQFEKINEAVNKVRKISQNQVCEIKNEELNDILNKFKEAMNEDFNTPLAIVEFNRLVKFVNTNNINESTAAELNYLFKALGEDVLGLVFETEDEKEEIIPENIIKMAEERWVAKKNRDFVKSDELRNQLLSLGYEIVDSKDKYKINKK